MLVLSVCSQFLLRFIRLKCLLTHVQSRMCVLMQGVPMCVLTTVASLTYIYIVLSYVCYVCYVMLCNVM